MYSAAKRTNHNWQTTGVPSQNRPVEKKPNTEVQLGVRIIQHKRNKSEQDTVVSKQHKTRAGIKP
jgi:hypothetical protein